MDVILGLGNIPARSPIKFRGGVELPDPLTSSFGFTRGRRPLSVPFSGGGGTGGVNNALVW